MTYEKILKKVGSFGRYQKWLCFYLFLSSVPNGYLVLSIVFAGLTPPHRCYVPELDGTNSSHYSTVNTASNSSEKYNRESLNEMLDVFIPRDNDGNYNKCHMFNGTVSSNVTNSSSQIVVCQHGWKYDIDNGRTTFVTEWNLVCSRSTIPPIITSIFMIGVMVGSALCGILADKVGRRPMFLAGTVLMFIFFGVCGLAPSPTVFSVMMFFSGASNLINYATAFVLASEIVDTTKRVAIGTITVGGFAVGYMLIPLVAYFITDWKMIYIATGLSGVAFLPYFWLIPESPRWLYTKERYVEFKSLMAKIGHANGLSKVEVKNLFQDGQFEGQPDADEGLQPTTDKHIWYPVEEKSHPPYCEMIRNSITRFRFFNICFTWFSNAVIYYGISLNTSNLGGSPYFNCFIAAAVEIPAYVIVIFSLKKIGRKQLVIGTILVSGVACGLVPFLREVSVPLSIAMAMVGKFGVAASFDVVYIYCAELFPTVIRNTSVGFGSTSARIGAAVAPYLIYLEQTNAVLPYTIMLILSVTSALLTVFLPETGQKPLPETYEDLERYMPRLSWMKVKKLRANKKDRISAVI
ncbi:unnamed protein product [Clavelina lepadiformis]|uniref:Major facilitator superfamily (MFS) profile domain-containing protein n=1 Tax=Clavelina lepadiformis TaxID=159417 RepID=A0ABP0GGF7_CLALP